MKTMTSPSQEYMGLKARLSQAWLASPLIVLIIFIVKLELLKNVLLEALGLARNATFQECDAATKSVATAMQAPIYTIDASNRIISSMMTDCVQNLMDIMKVTVTAVEGLILFALDMTLGTYSCLTISAINIGANEALNATESVVREANKTAHAIGKDINAGLGKLTQFVNGAIGLIDSVDEFVTGGESQIQNVNLTVSKLERLNISSDISDKLEVLRTEIPTYEGTKKAMEQLIKKPFDGLKQSLGEGKSQINITYDPFSQPGSIYDGDIRVCDRSKVEKVFEELDKAPRVLVKVFTILCGLAIIAGICVSLYKAWSHWKRLQRVARYKSFENSRILVSGSSVSAHDKLVNEETVISSIATEFESNWLERQLKDYVPHNYKWVLSYALAKPLVIFLGVGIAGLIITLLEYIIMKVFTHRIKIMLHFELADAKDTERMIAHAYEDWRQHANSDIASTEAFINRQILGKIHQSSKGLNNSISSFIGNINSEMQSTFQGTGLLKPMQAVAGCLFEDKVERIEKGLTWIYSHSQIKLPRIEKSSLQSSQYQTIHQVGGFARQVIQSTIGNINHELKIQLLVSCLFLLVWLVFTIGAVLAASQPLMNTHWQNWTEMKSRNQTPGSKCASQVDICHKRPGSNSRSNSLSSNTQHPNTGHRVSRLCKGPALKVSFEKIASPQRASIQYPETPKTPLRAMMW